jgi:hypothetical protein
MQPKSKQRIRVILAILIVLAIGLVILGVVSSQSRQANDPRLQAWAACTGFIQPQVSPGTTPYFQMEDLSQVQALGAGQYRVQMYVDETDRFGAVTRRTYTCTIASGAGGWKLLGLIKQ